MRQTISGLVAAIAVLTVSAPAMACGGLFSSGCSPCGQAYVSPCAESGFNFGYGAGVGYGGGYGYAAAPYQQLPDPNQYYYVNQGPVHSGPGNLAPAPYYQERAVTIGYGGGGYGYGGGYGGGYHHRHHHGMSSWRQSATYSYRPRSYVRSWRTHGGYYGMPRHSYAPRHYGYRYGTPRMMSPHYSSAPRHYGRPLRRYN